jgi:enterochelin esterase family protein
MRTSAGNVIRGMSIFVFVMIALTTSHASVAAQGLVAYKPDPRPGIRAGTVQEFRIPSREYGRDRRILIYAPAGYSENHAPFDLLVAFDANEYMTEVRLPVVLDTLIALGRISPTVAILIDDSTSSTRLNDLANHARFVRYIGNEVIPFVRGLYNITRSPRRSVIMGSSSGGLAAAQVAGERPDLFGNVLALSGAFWRGNEGSTSAPFEWLTARYGALPKRNIAFILDVGTSETNRTADGSGPVFIDAVRRFRSVLVQKKYAVQYTEIPGGTPSYNTWKKRIPTHLVTLFRL